METSIGLDIGSSAVRAAEISTERGRSTLRRYAQVGLPEGAVLDGEIVNGNVVAEALRRLWAEGGFTSRRVVLGVSGHRVIVRQAEVPALNEEDLRSSLSFDTQELIPIPMEDASFDFRILERGSASDQDGRSTMRILVVAAHKELLRSHLGALQAAGLEAAAIDAAPLALMRVVPPDGPGGGTEAIVAIGAEMTTVAVRQDGVPGFIRSLAVGGSQLTAGIASSLHVEIPVAESLKRGFAPGGAPQLVQARKAMYSELRDLGEEVRATVDFFAGQAEGASVQRLLVTGGASQTEGLVELLAGGMDVEIHRIDPFSGLLIGDVGLDESTLRRARTSAATAVGLALWSVDTPGDRLSVLPNEVAEARRNRRLISLAGVGVAGLVALLAVAGVGEAFAVHNAKSQVSAVQRQEQSLQGQVAVLTAKTSVHQKLLARKAMVVKSLQGDLDWVGVLAGIDAVKPSDLTVQTFSGTRTNTPASGPSTSGPVASVGTVTFSVTGSGGLPAVATWLDGLQHDPSLAGSWVSGISVTSNGGQVTFSSNSNLTTHAESNRSKAVQ